MSHQLTFADSEFSTKRRQTRKEIFLSRMEQILPWQNIIDFMLQHPILINRPIVVTPLGTRLCRPSEVVLDILPDAQKHAFTKEDGEKVVDDAGKRLK
ncbi:ArsC/Spx/MgsR family protein [Klebsiella pneumoniae]|uniref:ArsC/Spx/MgsR family protein n=1 Tax=Klebsiella pneumoniae TaxID=573 RepID=UPI001083908A|nr:ArsC/Spx/MgsR family protein [Klebsiella pneumoniae]VGG54353.1 Arsenate reductase [Klebsiella pneumoniae]